MAELLACKKLYETFADKTTETESKTKKMSTLAIVGWLIWLVWFVGFGMWAANLSWTANTLAEWGFVWKVFFAVFAFLFGLSYVLPYYVYKADLVRVLMRLQNSDQN